MNKLPLQAEGIFTQEEWDQLLPFQKEWVFSSEHEMQVRDRDRSQPVSRHETIDELRQRQPPSHLPTTDDCVKVTEV